MTTMRYIVSAAARSITRNSFSGSVSRASSLRFAHYQTSATAAATTTTTTNNAHSNTGTGTGTTSDSSVLTGGMTQQELRAWEEDMERTLAEYRGESTLPSQKPALNSPDCNRQIPAFRW
ncbi:hypothetical protein GQ42DRAFT_50630 [Ramicandelaber brevisporus]|nr:hypothetical protein GQ42DRAFT_50630 [Ramicandelaber brevisporus]